MVINTGITGIVINDFKSGIMSLANYKSEGKLYVMESIHDVRLATDISNLKANQIYKHFKNAGLRYNTLFIVISSNLYKSTVQSVSDKESSIQEVVNFNKSRLEYTESCLLKHRITTEDGSTRTILVESVSSDTIEAIYKAFARFNIKYLVTEDSLYSLMGLSLKCTYDYLILSLLGSEHLNSYVYKGGSLVWSNKYVYDNQAENEQKRISEAIDSTVTQCANNYFYPTDMLLIGSSDIDDKYPTGFSSDNILIHTKELRCQGPMGILDFVLSNTPINNDCNKTIINYSPWHTAVIRATKFFCIVAVVVFTLFLAYKTISCIETMNRYEEVVNYSQQTDSFEGLQNQLKELYDERVRSESIVESIKEGDCAIDLGTILRMSVEHIHKDITILSVSANYIIGYGDQLGTVTDYVKDLSNELPYTVELYNVSQLKVGDNVYVGFELRRGEVL